MKGKLGFQGNKESCGLTLPGWMTSPRWAAISFIQRMRKYLGPHSSPTQMALASQNLCLPLFFCVCLCLFLSFCFILCLGLSPSLSLCFLSLCFLSLHACFFFFFFVSLFLSVSLSLSPSDLFSLSFPQVTHTSAVQ